MKNFLVNRTIYILIVAVLCSSVLSGCSLFPEEEEVLAPPLVEPKKTEYELYEIVRKDLNKTLKGSGNLIAVRQEEMYFSEAGGRFLGFEVEYGQEVEKGTVLCRLDAGNVESRMRQQENNIKKAELQLDGLRKKYQRYASMPSELQLPPVEMEEMQRNIKLQEIDLENAKIALEDLKKDLKDSVLVSPIKGIVTFVEDIDKGDEIEAYKVLVTVADPKDLQLLYQSDTVSAVKNGMKAKITYNDSTYEGEVVLAPDNLPDDAREKYDNSIIIKPDGLPGEVKWGDYLDFEVFITSKKNVIVIPKRALRKFMTRDYVQILDGDSKKEVDVELGIENSFDVEIIAGLKEGQKVIINK